jgi:5-methylcytosine-specific restriction endonuclease McrA
MAFKWRICLLRLRLVHGIINRRMPIDIVCISCGDQARKRVDAIHQDLCAKCSVVKYNKEYRARNSTNKFILRDISCLLCHVDTKKWSGSKYQDYCNKCAKKLCNEAAKQSDPERFRAMDNLRSERYRKAHPDRRAATVKRWAYLNADRLRETKILWAARNPEKLKLYRHTAYYSDLEKSRSNNTLRRKKNLDGVKAAKKRYTLKNIEKIRTYIRSYHKRHYEANRTAILEKSARWKKENPEAVAISGHKRRALKRGSLGGSYTVAEWKYLVEQYKGRCADCGAKVKLTVGHKIPLSRGGSNHIVNIIPQCAPCNARQYVSIHPKAELSLWDRPI